MRAENDARSFSSCCTCISSVSRWLFFRCLESCADSRFLIRRLCFFISFTSSPDSVDGSRAISAATMSLAREVSRSNFSSSSAEKRCCAAVAGLGSTTAPDEDATNTAGMAPPTDTAANTPVIPPPVLAAPTGGNSISAFRLCPECSCAGGVPLGPAGPGGHDSVVMVGFISRVSSRSSKASEPSGEHVACVEAAVSSISVFRVCTHESSSGDRWRVLPGCAERLLGDIGSSSTSPSAGRSASA
mmetsp:Transcript_69136/g.101318  ORF Transcript_69136/g.101318 Transcript_69136/m.101318 type:complete len:244 (+) Transcript_69136:1895-2626(+)